MSPLWESYDAMRPFDGRPACASAWGATHKKAFDWHLYCIEHMLRVSERASAEVERDRYRQTSHPIEYQRPVERKPRAEPKPPERPDIPDRDERINFVLSLRDGPICEVCGQPAGFKVGELGSHVGHWACINHYTSFY